MVVLVYSCVSTMPQGQPNHQSIHIQKPNIPWDHNAGVRGLGLGIWSISYSQRWAKHLYTSMFVCVPKCCLVIAKYTKECSWSFWYLSSTLLQNNGVGVQWRSEAQNLFMAYSGIQRHSVALNSLAQIILNLDFRVGGSANQNFGKINKFHIIISADTHTKKCPNCIEKQTDRLCQHITTQWIIICL